MVTETPMQVGLRQLREQQEGVGDQGLLELTFDMLQQAEASNRDLVKALKTVQGRLQQHEADADGTGCPAALHVVDVAIKKAKGESRG